MEKINVAVLGVTGIVGSEMIKLLIGHPKFSLAMVCSSKRSSGKQLKDYNRFTDLPSHIGNMIIEEINIEKMKSRHIKVAFSALPSDIAEKYEKKIANENIVVFSNAKAHRTDRNVPILIPEINPDHMNLVKNQTTRNGFIVTNSNCSTSGLALGLAPLTELGIKNVFVTTYQALSGAGYPGVPSLDALGNVIPFIDGEEAKIEFETRKILGQFKNNSIIPASFKVNASCARVPVRLGHLEAVTVEIEKNVGIEDVLNLFSSFKGIPDNRNYTLAPKYPIIIKTEPDRPQPLLDLGKTPIDGMKVTIGRIRKDGFFLRFFLLVHNTIRGAAGASILNAEYCANNGYLKMEYI